MTYAPLNIFQVRGKELPRKGGGTILAIARHIGGGWDVISTIPPKDSDYSDRMLPMRFVAENVDVWTACRLLNEEAVKEVHP